MATQSPGNSDQVEDTSPCESTDREFLPGDREMNFSPNPQLVAEGWQRRFMADKERAEEARDLYASLGYEVRLEPVAPAELHEWCADCRALVCRAYVTLYTRK